MSRRWWWVGGSTLAVMLFLLAARWPLGWWDALEDRYGGTAWDWVERASWFAAIIPGVVALYVWMQARPTVPSATTGVVAHHVDSDSSPTLARHIAAPIVGAESRGGVGPLINHEVARASLQSALSMDGPGVIMVCGLPGVGKSWLVKYVLAETGRADASFEPPMTSRGRLDVATLLSDIDGGGPALHPGEDLVTRLAAALEAPDGDPVTILVDDATSLVDPDVNRFYDMRFEEAVAVIAGSGSRAVKLILVLQREPNRSGGENWPSGVRIVSVGGLSGDHFRQYMEMLEDEGRIDLGQVDVPAMRRVLDGVPRLADLFCTALKLPSGELTAGGLIRRLAKTAAGQREVRLAQEIVKALDVEQRRVMSALVAFGAPVSVKLVIALLHGRPSAGRIGPVLRKLEEMRLVVTVDGRPFVPNAEVRKILQDAPDGALPLLDDAADVLAENRIGSIGQFTRIEQFEQHFVELDVQVRAGRWISAYELIGRMYEVLSQWHVADLLLKYRLGIRGKLDDDQEMVNENAIGLIYLARGDVSGAEKAFNRAARKATGSARRDLGLRAIRLNMAEVEWRQNDLRAARKRFEQVLEMTEEGDDSRDRMAALEGLADCHRRWGDHDEAIRLCRDALSLAQRRRAPDQVRIGARLARWLSETGDLTEAATVMAEVDLQAAIHGDTDTTARVQALDARADLALDAGMLEAAEDLAGRAVAEALALHEPVIVLQARTTLAMVYLRNGRHAEAWAAIEAAVPYQRSGRALIVPALRALIAFLQHDEGWDASLFKALEGQARGRREDDGNDFSAAEFEGIALAGIHAVQGRHFEDALVAFSRARQLVPILPEVLRNRLEYMILLLKDRLRPDEITGLLTAATVPITAIPTPGHASAPPSGS